jgi:hypothetical protein
MPLRASRAITLSSPQQVAELDEILDEKNKPHE